MLFKKKRGREREKWAKFIEWCMKFSHKVSNMSTGAKRLGPTVVLD
jgi:hypothetical protein